MAYVESFSKLVDPETQVHDIPPQESVQGALMDGSEKFHWKLDLIRQLGPFVELYKECNASYCDNGRS